MAPAARSDSITSVMTNDYSEGTDLRGGVSGYMPVEGGIDETFDARDDDDNDVGQKDRPVAAGASDDTPKPPRMPSWIFGPLQVMLYYCVGFLYYTHAGDTQWDVHTAFYFTSISITTVGYGDFSPTSAQDKLFTMVYVVFGFVSVYAVIGDAMANLFTSVELRIKKRKQKEAAANSVPADDTDVNAVLRGQRLLYMGLIFLLQLAGAGVVCYVESWPFVDGLYWAFQTTSTVGYGDEFLHKRTRIFGALYALTSVGTLAACFAGLAAAKQEADAEKHYRKLMRHELNQDLILKLDKNGDGVSRAEFLMGMLVAMDLCEERECLGLLARFDELDSDQSGQLDSEDLQRIADSFSSPVSAADAAADSNPLGSLF